MGKNKKTKSTKNAELTCNSFRYCSPLPLHIGHEY